eukprot:m.219607 g.219607  ORF g.219607 m.219607 type:complete len:572 (-) comp33297_c0_seq5:94-1809(-)
MPATSRSRSTCTQLVSIGVNVVLSMPALGLIGAVTDPFQPPQYGQNNVYGCVPGVSTPPIMYLGTVQNWTACENLCLNLQQWQQQPSQQCFSYTWHVGNLSDSRYDYMCYGRTDKTWSLVAEVGHVSGKSSALPPTPTCKTNVTNDGEVDSGCNNAGVCINGSCVCDPTWRGATCSELALLPAQSQGNGLQSPTQNTWGGSVIHVPNSAPITSNKTTTQGIDGGFHMFASMFVNATLASWETNSVVVHATSTFVQGPYAIQSTILPPRRGSQFWDSQDCHNPTVHKIGNEYVIFYIGVGGDSGSGSGGSGRKRRSAQEQQRPQSKQRQRQQPQQRHANHPNTDLPQVIGAAFSESASGPWARTDQPLLTPSEPWECGGTSVCGVSNPAIVQLANGTVLMFYRGNNDRGLGVASAPSWRGPYTKQNNGSSLISGDVVIGLEDMYVFQNAPSSGRKGCHMILHQEEAGTENLGAHAFTHAEDCTIGWQLTSPRPSRAYGPEFSWDNGSVTSFASRERPQLVFDPITNLPSFLSNGIVTTSWAGATHTLVAPINTTTTPTQTTTTYSKRKPKER